MCASSPERQQKQSCMWAMLFLGKPQAKFLYPLTRNGFLVMLLSWELCRITGKLQIFC